MGLYEYMLLSEELGAEPIWVINNGLRYILWSAFHHLGQWDCVARMQADMSSLERVGKQRLLLYSHLACSFSAGLASLHAAVGKGFTATS